MQTSAPPKTLPGTGTNGGALFARVNAERLIVCTTLADARLSLPFPRLLDRLGIQAPDRDKFKIKCPIHDERNGASFAVERKNGVWFWYCFGKCGRGGDEVKFIEAFEGLPNKDAIRRYIELAQNGAASVAKKPERVATVAAPFDWQKCVDAFTTKDVAKVAAWRGYSPEFVQWLHANKLVGIHDRHIALPVAENGRVIGAHYKVGKDWFYAPKGIRVQPFVIGELVAGDQIHVFESQWDAFALMDATGTRDGIVCTRGASNGALVASVIPENATVYAWKQNDELKRGKRAGDEWLKAVVANTKCAVKSAKVPEQFGDLNDWTRDGATDKDLLAAMCAAEVVRAPTPERPLIEFRSPLELKNFTPPPGLVLVGDFHIVTGSVFVEGGPPGVGKSRGAVALAVAGATGSDWFGLQVHRKFKTLIVQTENGEFRLAREFAELDCETLEDFVRICPPPPYGLCFGRKGFREQLSAAVADFAPDVVVYDPWNAAAREQDSKEYLDTFDALKSVLPLGDDAPALGIVAHTRKPKTDERTSGRALLNLLAGSYVLGSVPRTVFVMQAASDATTDNRVVWTCCKNNDGELGARSAWERRNGLFAPVTDFDWNAFDAPGKDKREAITESDVREIFENGALTKADARDALEDATGASRSSIFRALSPKGRFAKHLKFEKGKVAWR
jgi:hypothetical protein